MSEYHKQCLPPLPSVAWHPFYRRMCCITESYPGFRNESGGGAVTPPVGNGSLSDIVVGGADLA